MIFETYFRLSSYLMIACGALALALSDGVGLVLGAIFAGVLVVAWNLEGSRWQLSERVGLVIVLLSLPLFYFDWKFLAGAGITQEKVGVSALAHLILFLSSVKLLQVKADRDWVFLYLISFFEILLSAGLSISPLFLATLSLYSLFALSTIVAFEIKKAKRNAPTAETKLLVAPDSTLLRRLARREPHRQQADIRRLPLVAGALLLLIFAFALPLFFITPRTGASALTRGDNSLGGFVGFSDRVELGAIGRLQQSNQVVMRVRVEGGPTERARSMRWRGVALDKFDGRRWEKSRSANLDLQANNENGFFQLGTTEGLHRLTTQTFFVEPIDTPVLFAAPRVVAVQAALPYIRVDKEGALSTHPHSQDRLSYKVYSDTEEPDPEILRADAEPYPRNFRYLLFDVASLDKRIAQLAQDVIVKANARNRYDAARAIEKYLQTDFGYTLDLKAGGPDPLSDFLFNIKEGHCEYFSTAMAVMLRTQGIATRIVNGFQRGEYNDTADVYTVTQRDAHSWVEVYFPGTNAWVTFDPTPAAGRPTRESVGLLARARKYAEALELLWMQYVVGYDKQEQRQLASSVRGQLGNWRRTLSEKFDNLKSFISGWWSGKPDGHSSQSALVRVIAVFGLLLLPILLFWLGRRIWRLGFWRAFKLRRGEVEGRSAIEFYERLTKILAARGLQRASNETPLEFATAIGMDEALRITRAYNRVRYGEQALSPTETAEIDEWLKRMEEAQQ